MNDKVVNFTIEDGKIKIDAEGFHGEGCADAVQFLVDLGESITEHKPEYRQGAGRKVRA
jgi:hypothetical protein